MSTLVEKLSDAVKGAGVSNVYGEPTELNGVTIVPVALSVHAFGAGEGKGPEQDGGEGDGGGGFAASVPIGAYVRDIRGLRFEPNPVALLAVGVPFVWVVGRALKILLKLGRKR
jgi:uncharacterized spore protein YtfJ